MADRPVIGSLAWVQSQSHTLAAVHAWTLLEAICGHSRRFFGDGPASLPVEPCALIFPTPSNSMEEHHA